jgi:phosphatidylinositol alpha-mannosyltransferase
LRVCIVVPYDISEEGGVKRHAHHLAESIRRTGDEVEIVGPLRGGDPGPNVYGFGGVANIPANGADNHIALWTPPWSVAEFFRQRRFDVVHIHEPMVPLLPWYALWLSHGAARIATFHMYAESEGAASRVARAALARVLFPSIHTAVAVSKAAAEYAGRFWKRPLPVVPNGVPTGIFIPPAAPRPPRPAGPVRLLFVGNWRDPRKGLQVLLAAYRSLRSEGISATLDVIGKGKPDADQRSIPGVNFHGVVESEKVLARHYRECDVFVSPATGQESFGIVLLEAMSCARPIVCSDIRGYRDVVEPGGARLVPPGNPVALARGIADVARAPERWHAMGLANRERAESYDWTCVAHQVRSVYLEALDLRRGARATVAVADPALRFDSPSSEGSTPSP